MSHSENNFDSKSQQSVKILAWYLVEWLLNVNEIKVGGNSLFLPIVDRDGSAKLPPSFIHFSRVHSSAGNALPSSALESLSSLFIQ